MLKIKLARFGKRNQPHYRIVVNEARDKRDGKYVALLGHYSPSYQPKVLELDLKAYDEWITKGAQPTETVAALYKQVKSGKPFPQKKAKLSKKAQVKLKAAKEGKAEVKKDKKEDKKEVVIEPAEQIAEKPAEEAAEKPSEKPAEQPAEPAPKVETKE